MDEGLLIKDEFFNKYTHRAIKYGLLNSISEIYICNGVTIKDENILNINHVIEINKITKKRWLKRKLERDLKQKENKRRAKI